MDGRASFHNLWLAEDGEEAPLQGNPQLCPCRLAGSPAATDDAGSDPPAGQRRQRLDVVLGAPIHPALPKTPCKCSKRASHGPTGYDWRSWLCTILAGAGRTSLPALSPSKTRRSSEEAVERAADSTRLGETWTNATRLQRPRILGETTWQKLPVAGQGGSLFPVKRSSSKATEDK